MKELVHGQIQVRNTEAHKRVDGRTKCTLEATWCDVTVRSYMVKLKEFLGKSFIAHLSRVSEWLSFSSPLRKLCSCSRNNNLSATC